MRLPFEAMAVASTSLHARIPFLASIWGNDLTLHAESSSVLGRATRKTLRRVDALHTDCQRDQRLAAAWGFDERRPVLVIPGSGGVRTEAFCPAGPNLRTELGIPSDAKVLLNPRGIREYLDIPAFFDAIAPVLAARADAHVICTGMRGNLQAETHAGAITSRDRIHLLPALAFDQMPDLYRSADVSVSLSKHDGTPNTLLESMASGCFPVVAPVESVLEWITHEVNGLVVSASDPTAISSTLLRALDDIQLRERARSMNVSRIATDASLDACMGRALDFYELVAQPNSPGA